LQRISCTKSGLRLEFQLYIHWSSVKPTTQL
jgi:hypothetical protein